jgi:hypothetical protein
MRHVNKILMILALPFITNPSPAMADSGKSFLRTTEIELAATESIKEEDREVVIDITKGLLKINERVLKNLSKFIPASQASTIIRVRKHFVRLMNKLDTQPDTVLAATQDKQLESLLNKFGPGDPFSSLPFISVNELKPGDIILRCSSALSSQMTEVMIWSRYTHAALYIGNGMIVDSTWHNAVKIRSLADLLNESNRVSVLRLQGLTADQANIVSLAAQSKESSAYNFEGVKLLGIQKLDALTNMSGQYLGTMTDILGRAEYLPPNVTDSGKYGCSELIAFAFKAVNITLSHANGFTPGDIVRLSQAGFFSEIGRLQVPAKQGD